MPPQAELTYLDNIASDDPVLNAAGGLAYLMLPSWRPTALHAADKPVRVVWADLPVGYNGLFIARTRTVEVSTRLRGENAEVLAAILAHEITHASQPIPASWWSQKLAQLKGTEAANCLDFEIAAFEVQAAIWEAFPYAAPATPTEQLLDQLVTQRRQGRLKAFVLETSGYEQECLGRELRRA